MNRTLAQEWQYARAWDGEAGRASALTVVGVDPDVIERLEELKMVEQKVCKSKGHDAARQPARQSPSFLRPRIESRALRTNSP